MSHSEIPAPKPIASFYVVSAIGRTPCGTNVTEAMNVAELQVDENVRQATVYREGDPTPIARYVWDPQRHEAREDMAPASLYDLVTLEPVLEPWFEAPWFEDRDGPSYDVEDDGSHYDEND